MKIITFALFINIFFCISTNASIVKTPKLIYTKNSLAVIKPKITDKNHPYITTGVFFKKGDLKKGYNIIATDFSKKYPIQLKHHNYYADGSIRFALVTLYLKDSKDKNIHLISSKNAQDNSNKLNKSTTSPKIRIEIKTKNNRKHVFSLEKSKKEEQIWQNGNLLSQERYATNIWNGLNIDFDINHYHNGNKRVDIVFHYDRIYKTPMHNIAYNAKIFINGKIFKTLNNIKQAHHTKWRYPIRFGYKNENTSIIDINRMMNLGVFPRLDLSLGTSKEKIKEDYRKLNSNPKQGLLEPSMPTTGARDEIAIFPQWASRYLVSADEMARYTTLKHGEIAASIPWHFYDENTNRPALPIEHTKAWIDPRANVETNGIAPFKQTTKWIVDTAHQPSLVYIPFIITGDRYYYDTLKAIYMYNRLSIGPKWSKSIKYRDQFIEQVRAYGWFRRTAGEIQSILDNNKDPDSDYIIKQNERDLSFLYNQLYLYGILQSKLGEKYTKGQNKNIAGETTGMLVGYGGDSFKQNPNFMQDLAALGIGFEAGMGLQPWLKSFSYWQSQFIAGRFLQKHNGFPPEYGSVYKFMQFKKNPKGNKLIYERVDILKLWRDIFNYSVNSGYFDNARKEISQKGITGYPQSASLFTAYARASNAQLFNVTRNIDNIEAFGYLSKFLPMAFEDYIDYPSYRISPIFKDKTPLKYENIYIGSNRDNEIEKPSYFLIHGKDGDDIIKFEQQSDGGFIFGGDGNDTLYASSGELIPDISFENDYKNDISKIPRSLGSIIFGGDGNDRLISGYGNDILKGDENYGKGSDVFVFAGRFFGNDIIEDFNTKYDKIEMCYFVNSDGKPYDKQITKFQFNNRVEGLSFSRRDVFEKHNHDMCNGLTKQEQKTIRECQKYIKYNSSFLSEYEFFKELKPDFWQYLQDKKEFLINKRKSISSIYQKDDYEINENEIKDTIKFEKTIFTKDKKRRRKIFEDKKIEFAQRDDLTNIQKDKIIGKIEKDYLEPIYKAERTLTNQMLNESRFGEPIALDHLNNETIFNIGIKNYFKKSSEGGTIIDLMANTTPEEYARHSTHPFEDDFKQGVQLRGRGIENLNKNTKPNISKTGGHLGTITIKNVLPESLKRDHFIFVPCKI